MGSARVAGAVGLVVRELVTTALRYARATVDVTLIVDYNSLRVVVSDGDSTAVQLRGTPRGATGGFGLNIIDKLTQQCGYDTATSAKRVWPDIELAMPAHCADCVGQPLPRLVAFAG
jgi:two-component sensor histidine kinase